MLENKLTQKSFLALVSWFLEYKRDFPWRKNRTFYRVWVSEVMLQQTRAEVVISYFEKWMKTFPDIESLANASREAVIKCWEGLGYYSRARNLHEGAKQLANLKQLPDTEEQLARIKGIGPYTTGAILSFAYQQKALAIDGNVLRVLSRFFFIEEPIDLAKTKMTIGELLKKALPEKEGWIVSEALIELGALICKKKPECSICPLQKGCLAKKKQKQELVPIKQKKTRLIEEKRIAILVEHDSHFLIKKNREKVMKDLYEFPYFATNEISQEKALTFFQSFNKKEIFFIEALSKIGHSFTKYKIELFPFHFKVQKALNFPEYQWVHKSRLDTLPFSSGHKKIKERVI